MIRPALLVVVLLSGGLASVSNADQYDFVVWYDRTDGSAYLKNLSPSDTLEIHGYSIVSDSEDLLPGDYDGVKGWKAFEDIETQFPSEIDAVTAQLGSVALEFGSANNNAGNVSELTIHLVGLEFSPGETWFIGKPFGSVPIDDAGVSKPGYAFWWMGDLDVGGVSRIVGDPVPEPSTLLLATLAGLGLVAMRSRGLRSGARRPQ